MNEAIEGLNLVELLDLLKPTPEPAAISMTPQTPGWAVLGILLAALLIWAVARWRAHRRRTAYRRAALAELDGLGDDTAAIATLLRRTALAGYPRRQVAGLTGPDWLDFLDRTGGTDRFSAGPGQAMLRAPYESGEIAIDPALPALARDWIRHHRPDMNQETVGSG